MFTLTSESNPKMDLPKSKPQVLKHIRVTRMRAPGGSIYHIQRKCDGALWYDLFGLYFSTRRNVALNLARSLEHSVCPHATQACRTSDVLEHLARFNPPQRIGRFA